MRSVRCIALQRCAAQRQESAVLLVPAAHIGTARQIAASFVRVLQRTPLNGFGGIRRPAGSPSAAIFSNCSRKGRMCRGPCWYCTTTRQYCAALHFSTVQNRGCIALTCAVRSALRLLTIQCCAVHDCTALLHSPRFCTGMRVRDSEVHSSVQFTAICAVQYVLYHIVLLYSSTARHCIQCSTVQYSIAQYCSRYSTVLYCAVL